VAERTAALAVAVGADISMGELGGSWHPVAIAGRLLEQCFRPWRGRAPLIDFAGGAGALLGVTALAAGLGWAVERSAGRGLSRALLVGLVLKPTFSIRRLLDEGRGVADSLETDHLDEARERLRALVSRPTGSLSPQLVASAAIESVAENLADSVAAPMLFYVLFGLPGAAAYRVVNTADAMFGYHGETEWLGKPAARVDDLLNWLPSRLSALALIGATFISGGKAPALRAWRIGRRDGGRTASPNAGRPMAVMAGALGCRLEKTGHYVLGDGLPEPGAEDVRAAVRLAGLAAGLLVAAALLAGARR
jgi:adenosylcobinamide-phosphate synthase